ncbi:MAG: type II toxin-antitoxin system HicA family toxin [Acidobacteriia bacterium]|nr:type II toxin-antitoxin system HicA family toxin [Terriglobia bacterium]
MKLPRDLDGKKLASLLRPYGYQITRQTGSHMRFTSVLKGREHHVTIPAHRELSVGTLHSILRDVAIYLEMELATFLNELFGA